MNDNHIPAPLEHRPNVRAFQGDSDGLLLAEKNNHKTAWIDCESGLMEIQQ